RGERGPRRRGGTGAAPEESGAVVARAAARLERQQPVLAERARLIASAPPRELEQQVNVGVGDPGIGSQGIRCSHMAAREITGPAVAESERVPTDEARAFRTALHREFNRERIRLWREREKQMERLAAGELPGFLSETQHVRDDPDWRVAEAPTDLQDRRVEITGPVERKMMINALNSGANVFMA